MNLYLSDILDQPKALRHALKELDLRSLEPIRDAVQAGRIDRVILTGMGASLSGIYPAWLRLAQAGIASTWLDTSELIHHSDGLISKNSLVWIVSQSGRSAETVKLLEVIDRRKPAAILAITNDADSPLGEVSARARNGLYTGRLLLNAETELVPSTRTYLNTVAIGQLAAIALTSDSALELATSLTDLERTADGIESYLMNWESGLEEVERVFSIWIDVKSHEPKKVVFLGRGLSMASVLSGALCLQELARIPALGIQSAQFRHGPLEIADQDLSALIFIGDEMTEAARLNLQIWEDLKNLGCNAWLFKAGKTGKNQDRVISIPPFAGIGLPLAEIVPVQLMGYALCLKMGITPGEFRNIGKVTDRE